MKQKGEQKMFRILNLPIHLMHMVTFSLVEFEAITNPTDIECYFQNGCCNYLIKKPYALFQSRGWDPPFQKQTYTEQELGIIFIYTDVYSLPT
jgi:hypothetical protein